MHTSADLVEGSAKVKKAALHTLLLGQHLKMRSLPAGLSSYESSYNTPQKGSLSLPTEMSNRLESNLFNPMTRQVL